jgi:hypothetical protein
LALTELLATAPFFEPQWDSARAALPRAPSFDGPNLAASTLQGSFPVQNWQWPSALPPLPKVAAFDGPNLVLATLQATTPFQAFLWPNPYATPPRVPDFDPPFPGQAPPAPDVQTPQGGHWIPLTKKELARIKREAEQAKARQEAEWDAALKDKQTLHEQVMASLHPEKIIGVQLPTKEATKPHDDDDEDDVAFLLLYG